MPGKEGRGGEVTGQTNQVISETLKWCEEEGGGGGEMELGISLIHQPSMHSIPTSIQPFANLLQGKGRQTERSEARSRMGEQKSD